MVFALNFKHFKASDPVDVEKWVTLGWEPINNSGWDDIVDLIDFRNQLAIFHWDLHGHFTCSSFVMNLSGSPIFIALCQIKLSNWMLHV